MSAAARPLASILVPCDGSEPAKAALRLALSLAAPGVTLRLLSVVDEAPVIAQSATTVMAYDPTPLFEALDAQADAVIAEAEAVCAAAGVAIAREIVHDGPVPGILAACAANACDLIVMGTHARTGVARAFLGSTTDGVLRASDVPVLTTHEAGVAHTPPFLRLLVAVDDSDAADAALALAVELAATFRARIIVAHVSDTTRLYENAATYGFSPGPIETDVARESASVVAKALARASLSAADVDVALVEGEPAAALIDAAREHLATAIVMGSHGRRGLRRFFLGSVAEGVVREAPLPVLVVRRR